jgi:23S rRNA pseudouridine2605 synthase
MTSVFRRQFLWPNLRISVSSVTLPSMLERLQKIISRAGIASRRHAEQLIESGQVRVNGHVVKELGTKADIGRDRIEAAGRLVELPQGKQYFILHKPPRVVSTMSDPEGRHSLQQLLRGIPTRVYPVGRLDYALSGLLLLTSDGDLANRILKLAPRLPQTYWVKVKGRLAPADLARLGERLHARVEPIRAPQAARQAPNPWYTVTFSGASRDQLRRELFGMEHPVEKLRRVAIAGLELEDLPEGQHRELTPGELTRLKQTLKRLESTPIVKPTSVSRPTH